MAALPMAIAVMQRVVLRFIIWCMYKAGSEALRVAPHNGRPPPPLSLLQSNTYEECFIGLERSDVVDQQSKS